MQTLENRDRIYGFVRLKPDNSAVVLVSRGFLEWKEILLQVLRLAEIGFGGVGEQKQEIEPEPEQETVTSNLDDESSSSSSSTGRSGASEASRAARGFRSHPAPLVFDTSARGQAVGDGGARARVFQGPKGSPSRAE